MEDDHFTNGWHQQMIILQMVGNNKIAGEPGYRVADKEGTCS